MTDQFSLQGKRVLITGSSRGIGKALAIGMAKAGASVIVSGRDNVTITAVCGEIRQLGAEAFPLVLDVTQPATFAAALASLPAPPDVLVNNAGTEHLCPSMDVDEALWDTILTTNLKGAFFCAQAAARLMAENGGGSILNLCSLTSQVGVPGAAAYGASKSAMAGLTRTLATEWAAKNIRVNGIGPGYFKTDLTAEFYENADWCQQMQGKIPLGRFGELDDLTGAAVFLSSEAARYITGQVLYVDGGYLAGI
ncbi:2-deoxy-D-gluconate 3-dehydrogenase [Rahnella sp. AA]|uniref:SDR family NAD(P)-dependent oxidoreductase n=1 Tax=Rahnella sp. AA TaxID=2057180 RepID=UPI000C3368C2|nr:glucose 1-dehydrogenase [Rahnella sp. AA]PKE27978.1 2-deoxy-D-gluconate 3-dehydrogenase [Rahnella sp. AA]